MHNMLLIAKREYLERVRTKAFVVATVLIPVLMVGGFALTYIKSKRSGEVKHVTVVSQNIALATAVQAEIEDDKDAQMLVEVISPPNENTRQHLIEAVDAKDINGFLWIDTTKSDPSVTYYSTSSADVLTKGRLSGALRRALMSQSLVRHGAEKKEITSLMQAPSVQTEVVKNGTASESNTDTAYVSVYILFFLMYMAVMLHGMNVARSVIEEKTSRVFEVMLATVRPQDMMGGKLLGVGAVGLTQIGVWLTTAVVLTATPMIAAVAGGGMKVGFSAVQLIAFVVYFILGFLLYSGIAAALGAMVNSEQELQQFNLLIALPMAVCSFAVFPVITDPNSTFARVMSQIPTFTPLLMYVRISTQMPAWWEIALSLVIMGVTIYGVIWVSSRIYRVGVLMYGKRPTLPELLKWLKYS